MTTRLVIRAYPQHPYARIDHSTEPQDDHMSISAKIRRKTSGDLAVIGVRLLDDAHMTWAAAEVESERALRAWFDSPGHKGAEAYLAYRAAVDREEAAACDLGRLSELTYPCQERLARSD